LLIVTSFVIFWFAAGKPLVCFAALVTAVTSLGAVQAHPARRRLALWIGVALELALLIFFKYKRKPGQRTKGTRRARCVLL
jgi:hypothetical protein